MKRRRFLQLTASGLVVAGAGGGAWLWWDRTLREMSGEQLLNRLARDMDGVAVIGRAWLAEHPDTDPTAALNQALELSGEEQISPRQLAERLGEQVESDLAEDRLFRHQGWWLSQTEAKLAALHVALLADRASEAPEPSFENARRGRIVSLDGFHPDHMVQGGELAGEGLPERVIWFATGSRQSPRLAVMLDGNRISIAPRDHGFSIRLSPAQIERLQSRPGDHEIWLYDPVAQRRQHLGDFVIEPGESEESAFCPVDNWGPRETRAGQAFNPQPDGSAALWFQIGCFPDSTVVVFDGVELPTTLRPEDNLITARVPDASLYQSAGQYPVELLERQTGNTRTVGHFEVNN